MSDIFVACIFYYLKYLVICRQKDNQKTTIGPHDSKTFDSSVTCSTSHGAFKVWLKRTKCVTFYFCCLLRCVIHGWVRVFARINKRLIETCSAVKNFMFFCQNAFWKSSKMLQFWKLVKMLHTSTKQNCHVATRLNISDSWMFYKVSKRKLEKGAAWHCSRFANKHDIWPSRVALLASNRSL